MPERGADMRDPITFADRLLYLFDDSEAMRIQLAGECVDPGPMLRDNVSTDEITPARACYRYDERLADHVYTGLRCGGEFPVAQEMVRSRRFGVVVSGENHGKGSSREHAPFADSPTSTARTATTWGF